MIPIGEKLNSSIPSTNKAFAARDAAYVTRQTRAQLAAGAVYLDLNAAVFLHEEAELLIWAAKRMREAGATRIMVDSTNAAAVQAVLREVPLKDVILNSVSLQSGRLDDLLQLALAYNAGVVAMPMDDDGIPHDPQARLDTAGRLIERLRAAGLPDEHIYVDVLVESLGANAQAGNTALCVARMLRQAYPAVHLTGGISNISFGLPRRKALNAVFLSAAICAGVDSPIMDCLDAGARYALQAAQLINAQDDYCMNYITHCRSL